MGNKRARAQSRAVTVALVCAALLAMTIADSPDKKTARRRSLYSR
jgi:hypothetical protein